MFSGNLPVRPIYVDRPVIHVLLRRSRRISKVSHQLIQMKSYRWPNDHSAIALDRHVDTLQRTVV